MIRVLIADDHALVRAGVRALLEAQPDMQVVAEAEDGALAVSRSRQLRPDVVLMDLTMPGCGGIPAIEDLCRECDGTRVLVLTMHEDAAYENLARLAGAAGYVLKKALARDLIAAIRAVHAGKTHFTTHGVLRPKRAVAPLELISDREREVVSLIALGHTNAEIAGKLHISEKTVETHRAHVFEKLSLRTRADLVRFALEHGLMQR